MATCATEEDDETEESNDDDEEENYLRISLLLMGVSPRAVRIYFDQEFSPVCLEETLRKSYNALLDLKFRKIINQSQLNILFPKTGCVESGSFDVTLMICLIRNLTNISGPRKGYECLPEPHQVSQGDDLARIKCYRNTLAHLKGTKISNGLFNRYWEDISEAVGRLGGTGIKAECQKLRTKPLDKSNKEILLEVRRLREEIETTIKDTVPWNIREQIDAEITKWQKENKTFVNTRAATFVLQRIKTNNCVTVTGSSGVGKTATVRYVALQMKTENYDIIPVIDPGDVINFYHPLKKILFVIEDCCGKFSMRQNDLENWEKQMNKIQNILENQECKMISCCRLQVYQDLRFKVLSIFKFCECNLLSEHLCLLDKEKKMIAQTFLEEKASSILSYDKFDFFPLLCKLSANNSKLINQEFFESPFTVYENELRNLSLQATPLKYCALALIVMFNNKLSEDWLTDDIDKETRSIINSTCDACKLGRGTSLLTLRDELNSLIKTFIKRDDGFYAALHDKVFDFLVCYFGNTITACLIKNAQSEVIEERFQLQEQNSISQFLIILPGKYHKIYIKRLEDDWSKGKVSNVFRNINLKNLVFREKFLSHIKSLDIPYQRELAHKIDKSTNSTVLISCSFNGDTEFVRWCLSFRVDVNLVRNDDVSPLYMACQNGHTETVNILLNNKARTDLCIDIGASPLFIACLNGNTETVNILLKNKAKIDTYSNTWGSLLLFSSLNSLKYILNISMHNDVEINKCTNTGESPLWQACRNGYLEIVNMLLQNKADINKCNDEGLSPLFVACELNHVDIVSILLRYKADMNVRTNTWDSPLHTACYIGNTGIVKILLDHKAKINAPAKDGATPMFVACQEGHIDIVNILLQNKADIFRCMNDGQSPLIKACHRGHRDVVQILLNHNADVNQCTTDGKSSLYAACSGGNLETVNILLDNMANINKFDYNGTSPIHIACWMGHLEVVKLLLENKADINICMDNGRSPLYSTCEKGYAEIVKSLLNNKADVNECIKNGESSLYKACEMGHEEITILLMENKADIERCTNRRKTPLFIACEAGHTEIVKHLLDKKADINICAFDGTSPLYIACEKGHTDLTKILLENKADINKCRSDGKSPLCIARELGQREIVKILLKNKTDSTS